MMMATRKSIKEPQRKPILHSKWTTNGAMKLSLQCMLAVSLFLPFSKAFSSTSSRLSSASNLQVQSTIAINDETDDSVPSNTRRYFNNLPLLAAAATMGLVSPTRPSMAAVGSLPELNDTNAYLQGIRIRVADQTQLDAMITFLKEGFDCKILRRRIRGTVEEVWLGFGPEQASIPTGWRPGVLSFSEYGGHSSIALVCDSSKSSVYYNVGDPAPGDNIAYLQLAVPGYRISKMVAAGGNILDAYGHVDVVSPTGLPIRGIVGIAPDPIMLVAINCVDVQASKTFYQQLGFIERDVPYARPSQGATVFEPAPPAKSVFMKPATSGMGVLLIPIERRKKRAAVKSVSVNPVVESLSIVFSPAGDGNDDSVDPLIDPSGVGIAFQSVRKFQKEEKVSRPKVTRLR